MKKFIEKYNLCDDCQLSNPPCARRHNSCFNYREAKGAKDQQKIDIDIALKAYCKHECEDILKECQGRKKGKFCVEYRKFKKVLEQAMEGGEE